jgi:uncharacterized protein (DUF2141 family)
MRAIHSIITCARSLASTAQGSLTIEVELSSGNTSGTLHLAVCPTTAAYDSEQGCRSTSVKVNAAQVRVELKDLPEGRYAIKAFHDLNGNGEMDLNWIGIPKEPYGFSNNAMGTMGPPKFDQAAFPVKKGPNTTRFKMRG